MKSKGGGAAPTRIRERWLLLLLASVQFTCIVDFIIIMPLGPQYMRIFHIVPSQFGAIVSAYAFSAAVAGVAASLFLDRFDRKHALSALYFGFAAGTFLCAIAPSYPMLVIARAIAGAFGGLTGATILAIIADVVPEQRRGAAMGVVMSAFSIASIVGVPLGLFLANARGWNFPFLVLTALSLVVWLGLSRALPPIRGHLAHPQQGPALAKLKTILTRANHLRAFALMLLLTASGFCVIPYLSPYMVRNVGLTERQLPLIYFFGGLFTLFTMNWIGRLSDRLGKKRVFTAICLISVAPTLLITRLPPVPVWLAVATSTVFMISTSGRFVPGMAIITGSVEPRYRGGFMSLNSSMQQFAAGTGSYVSGLILGESGGRITHYGWVGWLSAALALIAVWRAASVQIVQDAPAETLPGAA